MSAKFPRMQTCDVRFPTSREHDGSDAMNPDPDYSAAYIILHTDDSAALAGHGFHEHFVDPVVVRQARYIVPTRPGFSSEMHAASLAEFAFPDGPAWSRSKREEEPIHAGI